MNQSQIGILVQELLFGEPENDLNLTVWKDPKTSVCNYQFSNSIQLQLTALASGISTRGKRDGKHGKQNQ